MKLILGLYLLNSLLFLYPLYKQFMIIVNSPSEDVRLTQKVLMFAFCLACFLAMWLCYFKIRSAAWFFFLIAIIAAIWNYKDKK